MALFLPGGMKFVKSSEEGAYDAERNAIFWNVNELPAATKGPIEVTLLPTAPGEQKLRVAGRAADGLADEKESTVLVEGVAALSFESGRRSRPDRDRRRSRLYHPRRQPRHEVSDKRPRRRIAARRHESPKTPKGRPRSRLLTKACSHLSQSPGWRPKAERTYRIRAQAVSPGDKRIKVLLTSDDMQSPVTKEESTRVFGDAPR